MLYIVRSIIRKLPGAVIKAVPLPEAETVSGLGTREKAGVLCRKFGFARVLLVTDKTVFSLELHEKITEALKKEGISCTAFSEISSEPNLTIIEQGRKALESSRADAIIALGGGAVMDSCKMIAAGGRLKNGEWGFREFTHPQTVLKGRTHFNLPLREHPYGGKNEKSKMKLPKLFEK